jgi:membrane associated rhomboid family serine protease
VVHGAGGAGATGRDARLTLKPPWEARFLASRVHSPRAMQLNPKNVGATAPLTAISTAADLSLRTTPECRSPVEEWACVNLPTLYAAAPRAVVAACAAVRGLPGLILSWRTEAPLTLWIVAINLVLYIVPALAGEIVLGTLWEIGSRRLDRFHEFWRLFTNAWIHFDFEHVASNCVFFLIGGRLLEPTIGSHRFGLLYLIAILGSSILSAPMDLYWANDAWGAGASGAVYGVFGALLVVPCCVSLWRSILVWLLVAYDVGTDMAYGPEPGIGFTVHAAGLITGMIAGALAGPGARAAESPDESPSTHPLPHSVELGTIGLLTRSGREKSQKSQRFFVARSSDGKFSPSSIPATIDRAADDPNTSEATASPAPRRIAAISVWPDEHGAENR